MIPPKPARSSLSLLIDRSQAITMITGDKGGIGKSLLAQLVFGPIRPGIDPLERDQHSRSGRPTKPKSRREQRRRRS